MPGWAVLVSWVAVYEALAYLRGWEFMSAAVWRWSRTPVGRTACLAVWATTTAHLLEHHPGVPVDRDPIRLEAVRRQIIENLKRERKEQRL